jgi:hypothetical protein
LGRISALAAVALAAAWMVGCSTTSLQHTDDGWPHFRNDVGGFAVLMPTRPKESITLHTNAGVTVASHEFVVDPSPSLELAVIYNDYPESLPYIWTIGSPQFFDAMQEAAMKNFDGSRLIDAYDGKFESHPMREIRIEASGKGILYQTRVIVVGHRMYQLIAVSSTGVDVSREVFAFFNSFSLL